MCKTYGLQLPQRYRRKARKDYLAFAKSRKHGKRQIRTAIRKQLSYVRRDIGYMEGYFSQGYVPDRIVSISQPWISLIVHGKVKAPVEFGAKLGRPSANAKTDKKQEYQDNTDRIEVEQYFSRSKCCYGLGCIVTKLEETQLTSIGGYSLKVA